MYCIIKNLATNKLKQVSASELYSLYYNQQLVCTKYVPFEPTSINDFRKKTDYAFIEGDYLYSCWIILMDRSVQKLNELLKKKNKVKNPKRQSLGRVKILKDSVDKLMESKQAQTSAKKKGKKALSGLRVEEGKAIITDQLRSMTDFTMKLTHRNTVSDDVDREVQTENRFERGDSSCGNSKKLIDDTEDSDHSDVDPDKNKDEKTENGTGDTLDNFKKFLVDNDDLSSHSENVSDEEKDTESDNGFGDNQDNSKKFPVDNDDLSSNSEHVSDEEKDTKRDNQDNSKGTLFKCRGTCPEAKLLKEEVERLKLTLTSSTDDHVSRLVQDLGKQILSQIPKGPELSNSGDTCWTSRIDQIPLPDGVAPKDDHIHVGDGIFIPTNDLKKMAVVSFKLNERVTSLLNAIYPHDAKDRFLSAAASFDSGKLPISKQVSTGIFNILVKMTWVSKLELLPSMVNRSITKMTNYMREQSRFKSKTADEQNELKEAKKKQVQDRRMQIKADKLKRAEKKEMKRKSGARKENRHVKKGKFIDSEDDSDA